MVTMPPMEISEIGTPKEIPKSQTNPLSDNRRRRPLRSRTVDTLLHILSLCYADSSHIIQNSDNGTNNDFPLDCTDIILDDSLFQEQMSMDETPVVLDTQEDGLNNIHTESAEHDHNILGEKEDFFQKVNTNPSVNFDIKNQDNYDMISSFPHLPTDIDVEEGEISGDFMDFMPEIDTNSVDKTDSEPKDFIGTKTGLENDNNLIPLFTEAVENGGKDMVGVVNKTARNLVNYSEIGFDFEHVLPLQSNLKVNVTKSQDLVYPMKDINAQNNKKRQGSCTEEERTNKKSKKSVDPTNCPENLKSVGEHPEDTSLEIVDASANKDAANEKKKKRVLTKERKAKKKMKERIKRAEKNRKLGVKRLKLQPVIKEKKIIYCRHYMKGRCHEGEKCKFSHDTIPLTKSKPCCYFARHTCMKGDDCPFDHQLSKYPCNNFMSNGFCTRGSGCMFSHEAQPSEAPLNASNESTPEQKPPSNSGSKKVETKSCLVPQSVTSNTEQKLVEITAKSARPPQGINFLSQEKLSPKVGSAIKEITKTPLLIQNSNGITKTPPLIQDSKGITETTPVIQDSEEITKMQPVIPRGINFLSFGKKPGLDYSNGGFSFKISNGIEKSRLSNVEGETLKSDSTVNVVNEVKVDFSTDRLNSYKKPMPVISFLSSTSQKALQSTLAFASKFDSGVKSKV